MLHPTKLHTSVIAFTLLAAWTVLPACDSKQEDTTEDEDKETKKKSKKKKSKKKKEEDDKDDGDTQAAKAPGLPGRTKKLAWQDADFVNDVPVNDTFETGSKTCNIVLNACMACRDRIKEAEGDMKLWSQTVSECFNLKTSVLELADGDKDTKCGAALKSMKGTDDCVSASHAAKNSIK